MTTNIYGVILAGGVGKRMGNSERPKQFLELAGKPVIIHTIEKFILHRDFEKILVLCPEAWMGYAADLVNREISNSDKIVILQGGSTGNGTVMNAIQHLDDNNLLDDETVIVVHDAVRPFVSHKIIDDNIRCMKICDACDTVIPASDTIVESEGGRVISQIPNRSHMYQGQMPQSFKAKLLRKLYNDLSEDEKGILTDACKIMILRGYDVHLVEGDVANMKITHPVDLRIARALIGDVNAE